MVPCGCSQSACLQFSLPCAHPSGRALGKSPRKGMSWRVGGGVTRGDPGRPFREGSQRWGPRVDPALWETVQGRSSCCGRKGAASAHKAQAARGRLVHLGCLGCTFFAVLASGLSRPCLHTPQPVPTLCRGQGLHWPVDPPKSRGPLASSPGAQRCRPPRRATLSSSSMARPLVLPGWPP